MSVPTGFGNLPPGVTDNDPHFGPDEDEGYQPEEPWWLDPDECNRLLALAKQSQNESRRFWLEWNRWCESIDSPLLKVKV